MSTNTNQLSYASTKDDILVLMTAAGITRYCSNILNAIQDKKHLPMRLHVNQQ